MLIFVCCGMATARCKGCKRKSVARSRCAHISSVPSFGHAQFVGDPPRRRFELFQTLGILREAIRDFTFLRNFNFCHFVFAENFRFAQNTDEKSHIHDVWHFLLGCLANLNKNAKTKVTEIEVSQTREITDSLLYEGAHQKTSKTTEGGVSAPRARSIFITP